MKYTKKQHDAISGLACMLDELQNKPRRLFSSLRSFAEAFTTKGQEDHTDSILDDLDDWENEYYRTFMSRQLINEIAKKSQDVRRELTSRKEMKGFRDIEALYVQGYIGGVKDACKRLTKEIITETLEDLY